jgi:DNA polymerase I
VPGLSKFLMDEVEMPLIPVVADMEDAGYRIDRAHFKNLRARLEPEVEQVLRRIREHAGAEFNPASPDQLRGLLYKKLKIKVTKRTPSGEPSTDKTVLMRAAAQHEIVRDIARYRTLQKIISTYTTIPQKADEDGRLRVSFNQLAAETGRFSSPSIIQTLPKSDEFEIRKGFIAGERCSIVGADFDQQELRVLAQCSADEAMTAAISAGMDLHGLAAVKVFKLECGPNEVKEKHRGERDKVKAIQFGLIYGRSAFSLAEELGVTKEDAERLIEDYFRQFPAVKRFIDRVHKRLLRDGYVDDLFGRRRHFPVVRRRPPRRKRWRLMNEVERALLRKINAAKREAQNFVIQGASATVTKLAMIRCHRHLAAEHPDIRMLLTLHDELQFEVPCELVDHFAQELPGLMCDLDLERFGFVVPMKVEVKVGPSWGELKKWEGARDGHADTDPAAR